MIFESQICGIPCKIEVNRFNKVKGSFRNDAPSDLDYRGYTESEWNVLDRRGRPAPWLERKITNEIRERIDGEVVEKNVE